MEITVDKLEAGDEVLIGLNGNLRYIRLLKTPKLSPNKTTWRGNPCYRTVLCSFREEKLNKVRTYTDHSGNSRSYNYTEVTQILSPDEHNKKTYIDLNERQMWLIAKNNN